MTPGSDPDVMARMSSTAEEADEAPRARWEVRDELADVGEAGAQLGVADLDGEHGVLERREVAVGRADGLDRGVEVALHPLRGVAGHRRLERGARKAVALGDPRVRARRAAVGQLNGAEQLRFEP